MGVLREKYMATKATTIERRKFKVELDKVYLAAKRRFKKKQSEGLTGWDDPDRWQDIIRQMHSKTGNILWDEDTESKEALVKKELIDVITLATMAYSMVTKGQIEWGKD